MKISRNFTCIINWILDNLCPPILRDCYPLMYPKNELYFKGEQECSKSGFCPFPSGISFFNWHVAPKKCAKS